MPVTGKYNLIQLGSVYFTNNGLSGGKPCKSTVTGLEKLKVGRGWQVVKTLSGKPYGQKTAALKGVPIAIQNINSLTDSVLDDIVEVIQNSIDSGTPITMNITGGAYGDFSGLSVLPDEDPVRFSGEFQNDQVKNVSFHFLTT